MSIHRFRKEVERLEKALRPEPEDEAERHRRLKMVQEGAEQENERFYRELARERRTAFLESVGYHGHTGEDLRDENFLYPGDEPPFTIAEDAMVFSTRDGRPITAYAQTLAEVWYWQEVGWGGPGLVHDEETQEFFTPEGELALSRDFVHLERLLGDKRMQAWESETR